VLWINGGDDSPCPISRATAAVLRQPDRSGCIINNRAEYVAREVKGRRNLTKVLPFLGIVLMLLHIVRPLGLPGLRRRRDFWKIAVAMGVAIVLTALLRHQT
jgi:hypothetical protein